jgi:hypothetical protein
MKLDIGEIEELLINRFYHLSGDSEYIESGKLTLMDNEFDSLDEVNEYIRNADEIIELMKSYKSRLREINEKLFSIQPENVSKDK